jgi:hypothetical protein
MASGLGTYKKNTFQPQTLYLSQSNPQQPFSKYSRGYMWSATRNNVANVVGGVDSSQPYGWVL